MGDITIARQSGISKGCTININVNHDNNLSAHFGGMIDCL
jgi:hypothetical protein